MRQVRKQSERQMWSNRSFTKSQFWKLWEAIILTSVGMREVQLTKQLNQLSSYRATVLSFGTCFKFQGTIITLSEACVFSNFTFQLMDVSHGLSNHSLAFFLEDPFFVLCSHSFMLFLICAFLCLAPPEHFLQYSYVCFSS